MTTAMAMPGNTAETFLVHFFGTGLADARYDARRAAGVCLKCRTPTYGRDGLLRAPRRRQGRAPRPRGGVRRPAPTVCRAAGLRFILHLCCF